MSSQGKMSSETKEIPWYKNKDSYKHKLLDLLDEDLANKVILLQIDWLKNRPKHCNGYSCEILKQLVRELEH